MRGFRKQVGDKGEDTASDFLMNKGYKIIQRNYRCMYGEVDIIAEYDEAIIFVEVRTRRSNSFGTPQDSITPSKINKISKTALCYIQEKCFSDRSCRFDVIAITYSKGIQNITHIENAFGLSNEYSY